MPIMALKPLLVCGTGCGALVASVAGVTLLGGGNKGISYLETFLISQSKDKKVKLYVQEKEEKVKQTEQINKDKEFEFKVSYEGKAVTGKLMLCSPEQDKNSYFLLKSDESWHRSWKNMKGAGRSCDYSRESSTFGEDGEKLSIKFENDLSSSATQAPKTIFLQNCSIKDLRKNSGPEANTNTHSIELSCQEQQVGSAKQVKILDQGLIK